MAGDRFTVDANILVGACDPTEKHHSSCMNVYRTLRKHQVDIHLPWTMPIEVIAAMSRKADGHKYISAVRELIHRLNKTWYRVDEHTSTSAMVCAAKYRLRGMDAIYASVALNTDSGIVSDDRDISEKLRDSSVKCTSSEKFFYKKAGN
jgi:predicted nucleic acid-binding protein